MSSILVTMISMAGIMLMNSPAGKFYNLVLFGHLCKGMHTFGVKCVMLVSVRGQDNSFMVPSNLSLPMGRLRNEALIPLGLC